MIEGHPFTKQEFDRLYSKVPRLTVEIVVRDGRGALLLLRRAIEPCKGQWHLPGGTVRFGELLTDAVRRVASRELGIDVRDTVLKGVIEYPSHFEHGLDSPVGIVFEVRRYGGHLTPNLESAGSGWFRSLPMPMHADQDRFLVRHRLVKSR